MYKLCLTVNVQDKIHDGVYSRSSSQHERAKNIMIELKLGFGLGLGLVIDL